MRYKQGSMMELRALGEGELETIAPLFEQVFGSPISPALLRWKYAEGRGESWTAWEGAALALHCGAMFRPVWVAGRRVLGAQMVDLMAAPKSAPLRRAGSPFAQLLQQLLTQRLPNPDCPDKLVFGLPSHRASRLLEQLGLGSSAGAMVNLVFGPAPDSALRWEALQPEGKGWHRAAQACWQGMSADLRQHTVCERSPAYLEQRFLRHPELRYTLLLLRSRWLRRPLGLAVLRAQGNVAELLDVVAPLRQHAAVLGAVRAWLHRNGLGAASFMASPPLAAHLGAQADRMEATQFRIMVNPFSPPDLLTQVCERWWFTGGDTEYR